jgi:hypothetical protein
MTRILFIFITGLIPLSLFSQKVTISIAMTKNSSVSEWQILDEKYMQVIPGNEFPVEDTVTFSLDANKRYFLEVSVSEIIPPDTVLYSLLLNNEPILTAESGDGYGDHFYPFFTGIKEEEEAKITGGSDTDISDFPWQVYLEVSDFTCGGSIINENWVITAAHCTKDDNNNTISANDMDVIVGANDPRNSSQGKKYYVSQVIVHEDFNGKTLDNDIALLKLKEPVSYQNAEPIKLVSEKDAAAGATDPGVMSWVTGYGLTSVRPATYPTTLQKVQLPIISNAQASVVWNDIPETDLMAGYLNGNKDACSGDSGGPLVVPVSNEYKLAGLVSWGSNNCNTYGAYTRISDFESWITAKTGIEISFTAPTPVGDSIICHGVESTEYYVSAVAGATSYEWQISPEYAGTITGNLSHATVTWDPGFTGTTNVRLRVTKNNAISDWSELKISVAQITLILDQSKDTVLCAQQPLNLFVGAEGHNLVFSWFKNGFQVQSGSSDELSFSGLSSTDSGIYLCKVTGSCGSDLSEDISLNILPLTSISDISPDTEVAFGENVALEVNANGHDLTYQWSKNDFPCDNGNSSIFELQDVNAGDIGLYQATVTGTCGVKISDKVYVYVKKQDYKEEPEVFVWPTLIKSEFNVALSNDQYYNITVTNITGKLLKHEFKCRYQTTLQLTSFPSGIYIVTVYNSSFRKSFKVIKNQ